MNPAQQRWERVKTLLEAAVELPAGERSVFLRAQCGDDTELLEEVESLVQFHNEAGDFIESPPAEVHEIFDGDADAAPEDRDTAVGSRIGAYKIVRELGRGGMGVVYLAIRADEEFEKRVAIKVVRRGMESDLVVKRFRNERQILARLEHANIARLVDGGSTAEGLPYFIMEYVEGKPITEYCDELRLSVRDRIEVFVKACDAVQYAHERNIVHRDLKPTNILVKANGSPKLLDFGIARWVDSRTGEQTAETTVVGVRMLTPAYASPEQLRGEALTPASDVYSLGVLLHELLCGIRPSAQRVWQQADGTTQLPSESIGKLHGENPAGQQNLSPEQISSNRGTTPDGLCAELAGNLDRIILRAIRINPAERFESVQAFADDLRMHQSGGTVGAATGERKSIVVLPFRMLTNEGEGDDYLGLALADAVTTKLSNVPNLSVRPTTSAARSAGDFGVDYVLDGKIHRSGDRVRIAVQLLRVRDQTSIWATQFDEALEDLLKLEDSISGQVALALIPQLSGDVRRDIGKRQTSNAKAYQAYLKGRWYWNQGTVENLAKALRYFMESIAQDPQYAAAHVGVADYYIWLGVWGGLPPAESFAAAKSSAARALEIDFGLADAHASLGFALWANDRDTDAAERELRLAAELNANCVNAHAWLALLYASTARHAESRRQMRHARALDPGSPKLAVMDGFCRYLAKDFDGALEAVRGIGHSSASDASACELKAWCYLQQRNAPDALEWATRAVSCSERSPASLSALACAWAANGNSQGAKDILRELQDRMGHAYVSSYYMALVQDAIGDRAGCIKSLQRAERDRDWWVLWSNVEPRLAGVERRRPARPKPAGYRDRVLLIAGVAALVVLAAYFVISQFHPVVVPFEHLRMAKLTTNGVAMHSAISPDGKYVAYVSNERGKQRLWLRQVTASGSVALPTPENAEISRMAFSGDGLNLSFLAAPRNDPSHGVLYVLPVPGGSLRAVMHDVTGPASLSPDGKRVVLIRGDPNNRRDELVIAGADGANPEVLATRNYPDRFSWPSTPMWSHDGNMILCGVEATDQKGFSVGLAVIRIADRSIKLFGNPRWQFVEQAAWAGDDHGFVVVGRDSESSFQQIWYVPYLSGEPKRLTNDLNDYTGLTVTADSSAVVTVQMQTLTNVYILKWSDPANPVQVTPGTGRYFDLSWSLRGEILYSSDASGTADIWIMNADGSGQRQLTIGAGRNYAPVAAPNGEAIVFHSNRGGNWNLWRMNPDGSSPRQLTFGPKDSNWPRFSPDGHWVIYHHTGTNGMWNLWKVSTAGGEPQQITGDLTMYPGVAPVTSPDGVRIACWYSDDAAKPRWKVAVLSAEGGPPKKTFDLPASVFPDTPIRWTPDGKALTFVDNQGGAGNLWVQPVDGGPKRPLTNFTWGQIYSFDWSRDGRLAYSRGLSSSDVVILRDVK